MSGLRRRGCSGNDSSLELTRHSLYTPVVFVLLQKLMLEEEPRVETTHVAVWYAVSVDDIVFDHIFSSRRSFGFVDRIRLEPKVCKYKSLLLEYGQMYTNDHGESSRIPPADLWLARFGCGEDE